MVAPLEIWTTGAPVPAAQRARGSFFDMIARHVAPAFSGELVDIDVTVRETAAEFSRLARQPKSGVIVTGSPAHVRQNDDWMKRTMEALVSADQVGTPILGICFGHQLLGKAWGGHVDFNPRGREIGAYSLTFHAEDPLLGDPDVDAVVMMTHLDSVVLPPSSARVIAATSLESHAALRFSATTWGVQFHPEMDAEIVGHYLADRAPAIRAEGLDPEAIKAELRDSDYGASLLARFARFCQNGAQF